MAAGVLDGVQGNAFVGLGRAAGVMSTFTELKKEYDALAERAAAAGTAEASDAIAAEMEAFHGRAATRVLALARQNGGIYIKAAQFVASLQGGGGDRQLPRQYKETLAALTDHAPSQPWEQVVEVLEEEIGAPVDEIFESIDKEPTASASLAQVHRARLKRCGEGPCEVAVKIQYKGLREQMASDFCVFEQMANTMRPGGYDLSWLVKDLKAALNGELDFATEAKHTERAYANLCDRNSRTFCRNVAVARVVPSVSSGRVLVTEWMDGLVKCNDAAAIRAAGLDPLLVGDMLVETFMKMVLVSGFVHGDPHAGNVYVRRKKEETEGDSDPGTAGMATAELVVLDHGLYHTFSEESRRNFCMLYLSCIDCRPKEIEHYATLFTGAGVDEGRVRESNGAVDNAPARAGDGKDEGDVVESAAKLWRYFPLLLSPWFVTGLASANAGRSGLNPFSLLVTTVVGFLFLLSDISCALAGKLPNHVSARNIADFLVSLHRTNNKMLLIMHSIGYTRGLLNDLKYPEERRLRFVAAAACAGVAPGNNDDSDSPSNSKPPCAAGDAAFYQGRVTALKRRLYMMSAVFAPALMLMLAFQKMSAEVQRMRPGTCFSMTASWRAALGVLVALIAVLLALLHASSSSL